MGPEDVFEAGQKKIHALILDLQKADDETFDELMDELVSQALDAKDERVDEANSDNGARDIR